MIDQNDKKYQEIIDFIQNFCNKQLETDININKSLQKNFSDIGLSSIEVIELITLAEKKFHISIEGSDLPAKETIKAYADLFYEMAKES